MGQPVEIGGQQARAFGERVVAGSIQLSANSAISWFAPSCNSRAMRRRSSSCARNNRRLSCRACVSAVRRRRTSDHSAAISSACRSITAALAMTVLRDRDHRVGVR